MVAERPWFAAEAAGAPFVAHLLADKVSAWGCRLARCGESRAKWRPVGEFARPEVFRQCERCKASVTVHDSDPDGA